MIAIPLRLAAELIRRRRGLTPWAIGLVFVAASASVSAAQNRPWFEIEAAGIRVSRTYTEPQASGSSPDGPGVEARGRVGWRVLSLGVSHRWFEIVEANRLSKVNGREWPLEPRAQTPEWYRLSAFVEGSFARTRDVYEASTGVGPLRFLASGEGRGVGLGGSARYRWLKLSASTTRGRTNMGPVTVDGFEIGDSASRLTTRLTRLALGVRF